MKSLTVWALTGMLVSKIISWCQKQPLQRVGIDNTSNWNYLHRKFWWNQSAYLKLISFGIIFCREKLQLIYNTLVSNHLYWIIQPLFNWMVSKGRKIVGFPPRLFPSGWMAMPFDMLHLIFTKNKYQLVHLLKCGSWLI